MPNLTMPGGRTNGKPGGSKRVTLSPSCELKQIGGAWVVCPSAKFISDCKEQGRSEVTRLVADHIVIGGDRPGGNERYTEGTGYGISRPSQNPPVLPPLDPVEAPNWTMPLRIGLGLLAVVVVVILAVVL